MFVVPPSMEYIEAIDFRVLGLLYGLMLSVAGFTKIGVFERLLELLLKVVKSTRGVLCVLVFLCFFSSMWITNDVALITFVPFAIMSLNRLGKNRLLIYTVVLQTIAANLGSMCTPLGNPQNLYLYSVSGITLGRFLQILLPYSVVSFLLLLLFCFLPGEMPAVEKLQAGVSQKSGKMQKNRSLQKSMTLQKSGHLQKAGNAKNSHKEMARWAGYSISFLFCLLTILHVVDYRITVVCVTILVVVLDVRLFWKVDYMLLLTFVAFFLFVGNVKQMEVVHDFLANGIRNFEVPFAIGASQLISNVPAAVLLSGFTDDHEALLIGTNLGGLGTLTASMASLISYKFYQMTTGCNMKKYLLVFTGFNLLFLGVLFGVWAVL